MVQAFTATNIQDEVRGDFCLLGISSLLCTFPKRAFHSYVSFRIYQSVSHEENIRVSDPRDMLLL